MKITNLEIGQGMTSGACGHNTAHFAVCIIRGKVTRLPPCTALICAGSGRSVVDDAGDADQGGARIRQVGEGESSATSRWSMCSEGSFVVTRSKKERYGERGGIEVTLMRA